MKPDPKAKLNISRKRNTFWTLFYEYWVLIVTIIKGLVLVPVYLKYIDKDLYGYWLAMASVTIWLSAVDPGFSDVVRQQTAKVFGQKDYSRVIPVASASLLMGLVFACSMGAMGFVLSSYIGGILNINNVVTGETINNVFRMVVVGNIMLLLAFSFVAISQGLQQGRGCGIISLFANILSTVIIYVALIKGQGIYALALGPLVFGSSLLLGQSCYAVWNLKSTGVPFKFSISEFPRLWKLSWVNFFGKTSRIISDSIDNFLLARMLGPGQVVIFELTRRGPKFSGSFLGRIGNAASASIAHLHGEGNPERLRYWGLRIMQTVLWLLAIFTGCFLALNKEFISLWIGVQFYAGFINNGFIILWISALLVMNLLNILVFSTGAIAQSSKINIVYTLLLVPAIVSGIYFAGIRGLAIGGLTATVLVLYFYQWPLFQRTFNFRKKDQLSLVRESAITIIPVITAVFASTLFHADSWLLFIGKTIGCSAIIICMLAILSHEFKSTLLELIKTKSLFGERP